MYFMIKDEKIFDKYMIIWEKVSNMIKNNSELIYNKKYITAEKIYNSTKESFQYFYIPVIVFDSEKMQTIILECFYKNLFLVKYNKF